MMRSVSQKSNKNKSRKKRMVHCNKQLNDTVMHYPGGVIRKVVLKNGRYKPVVY